MLLDSYTPTQARNDNQIPLHDGSPSPKPFRIRQKHDRWSLLEYEDLVLHFTPECLKKVKASICGRNDREVAMRWILRGLGVTSAILMHQHATRMWR